MAVMKDIVKLQLSVENMSYHMIKALQLHSKDIEYSVNKACEEFINGGHLQRVVNEQFTRAVSEAISNYFKYGAGYKAVEAAVQEGMKSFKVKK